MQIDKAKQAEVSRCFGVHVRTINRWTKLGCPRNKDGTYELPAVIRWYLSHKKREIETEPDAVRSKRALADFRVARARNEKFKADQAEGELLVKKDVTDFWNMQILIARNSFRGLMAVIMPPLFEALGREGSAPVGQLIETEVERILLTMSKTTLAASEALLEKEKKQRKPTRRKPKKRTKKGTAQ